MLCTRVCEIISLERMAERNIIISSSVDIKLQADESLSGSGQEMEESYLFSR